MPTWTAPRLPPPDNTKAVTMAATPSGPSGRTVEGGGQARQGQRRQQEPEVAQGHVVVVGLQQQVGDDPGQPGGNEVTAELRTEGDDEARDDLDDPDGEEGRVGVAGHKIGELRGEVAGTGYE